MAATGRKPTLRSSRLGILICLRLRANQNVGEHPISLAPCREHRVGRHLFAEHVADRGQQGVGDMRIMFGPDAGFDMAGAHARARGAEILELVDILRIGADRGGEAPRSEARRGGKGCVSTWRSGWSPSR